MNFKIKMILKQPEWLREKKKDLKCFYKHFFGLLQALSSSYSWDEIRGFLVNFGVVATFIFTHKKWVS